MPNQKWRKNVKLVYRGIVILFIMENILNLPAFAQVERKENIFLTFGAGARAHSLSSAFVSIADDYSAAMWNPGGMAFINRLCFGAMHSNLALNRRFNFASMAFPMYRGFKMGLSWKGFNIGNIPARAGNTLEADYYFHGNEQSIGITFSQKLFTLLGLGLNVNYYDQSLNNEKATGFGLDAGLMLNLFSRWKVGLAFYDFKSKVEWSTGQRDIFKKIGRLGISYQITHGALIALAADDKNQYSAGIEVNVLESFLLRSGWRDNKLAVGLGFVIPLKNLQLNINYAVSNDQIDSELHHLLDFSLSYYPKYRIDEKVVRISTAFLNVRKGPGIYYKKIGAVRYGQKFRIISKKANWVKIKIDGKTSGWVNRVYVEFLRN